MRDAAGRGVRGYTGAGDEDRDGYADVLIGAPGVGGAAGAAYLVLGPPAAGTLSLGSADAIFVGGARSDAAGRAVGVIDADGDGFDDVLVGAPFADGGVGGGKVYLFLGIGL